MYSLRMILFLLNNNLTIIHNTMNTKIVFTIAIAYLSIGTAIAQDETDVRRFSTTQAGTTARSIGLGGAMGSIGADFGALHVNPSSMARYSKNEITFTPSFNVVNTPAQYLGTSSKDNNTEFNFQNIGVVFAARKHKNNKSAWRGSSFAIGFNKVANYDRTYNYNGINNTNSFTNALAAQVNVNGGANAIFSNRLTPEQLLAYNSFLIDTTQGTAGVIVKSIVPSGTAIKQSKIVTEAGGNNELNIGFGSNYNDEFLIGGNIGIQFLNYTRTLKYSEDDNTGLSNNNFSFMDFYENRTTTGTGINAKLGITHMPKGSNLRLGAALHTPTWIGLKDEYSFGMESNVDSFAFKKYGVAPDNISFLPGSDEANKLSILSDYNITTPYRAVLSGSYLFGKLGFVTADYEYTANTAARIKYIGDASFTQSVNAVIKDQAIGSHTLRLGAEARAGLFSLRAGGGFSTSSIVSNNLYRAGATTFYSLGAGFRSTSFFIDVAYQLTYAPTRELNYIMQDLNTVPVATVNRNANILAVTIGWKY
jgi:hypothetical protein